MEAINAGLGRDVCFSVVAPQGTVRRQNGTDVNVGHDDEPWWASLLRRASGMTTGASEWRS